jgi:hypothetical protein
MVVDTDSGLALVKTAALLLGGAYSVHIPGYEFHAVTDSSNFTWESAVCMSYYCGATPSLGLEKSCKRPTLDFHLPQGDVGPATQFARLSSPVSRVSNFIIVAGCV